jgi:hypothetical protein
MKLEIRQIFTPYHRLLPKKTVFYRILRDHALALGRPRAGGFPGIAPICSDLSLSSHGLLPSGND